MKVRTSKPSNNKYYMRKANGGYSNAVQGYPMDSKANVLSNCVGYANSRFNEIINDPELKGINKTFKYQLVCNAENFIESAKNQGLKISSTPVVGGIMVWQKGATLSGHDGAGHVAIVEKVIDSNTIYTSESAYGGTAFFNATRKNDNGRWGMGSAYKFRGCVINPSIKTTGKTSTASVSAKKTNTTTLPIYSNNKVYTVDTNNLNVRNGAGLNYGIKTKNQLTTDAQKNCNANGQLKKGTKVTCLATKTVSGNVWMKIPSGWVCAYYGKTKEKYVK